MTKKNKLAFSSPSVIAPYHQPFLTRLILQNRSYPATAQVAETIQRHCKWRSVTQAHKLPQISVILTTIVRNNITALEEQYGIMTLV